MDPKLLDSKPSAFHYINPAHPLARGCSLFLTLNEFGALTKILDASGRGNHASSAGGITQSDWETREFGPILDLDGGATEHLTCPADDDFTMGTGDYSIMAVLQDDTAPGSLATFHRIVSWYDGTNNHQLGLGDAETGGTRRFYLLRASGTARPQVTTGAGGIPTGVPYCVCVSYRNGLYRMFVDGVVDEKYDLDVNNAGVWTGNQVMQIGWRGSTTGTHVVGELIAAAVWKGVAFQEAEALELARDPWGILRPTPTINIAKTHVAPPAGGGVPQIVKLKGGRRQRTSAQLMQRILR